ncbi:MAG: hypothetical protein WC852_07315 [Candidatus Nanoarchaeia archaeon]|jgi:hypothetical protein
MKGLAALVFGAVMAIGCHAPRNSHKIYIPDNSCRKVQECGIVCYETLDSGRQIITIGGQEYSKADVMVNCNLKYLCTKDNGLVLIKQ